MVFIQLQCQCEFNSLLPFWYGFEVLVYYLNKTKIFDCLSDFYDFVCFIWYWEDYNCDWKYSIMLLGKGTRLWIKPLRIANCNKFPENYGEDYNPFRVIRSKHFSFNEYSYIIIFLITINEFFTSILHRVTFENKQNIKSLTKPILKSILLIFIFLKKQVNP